MSIVDEATAPIRDNRPVTMTFWLAELMICNGLGPRSNQNFATDESKLKASVLPANELTCELTGGLPSNSLDTTVAKCDVVRHSTNSP
jgi:hypothetical protein